MTSNVHANEIFAEALYWRASENIDWVYANDMHPPAQNITYKTLSFEYDPNFRVGVSAEDNYYRSLTYTRFYTHGSDAGFGNTISGFLSDRIAHFPNSLVYQAGQIEFKINYNIFDLDIGKRFNLGKRLSWLPVL